MEDRGGGVMEALILRRNYPVPVTFADLRRAREDLAYAVCPDCGPQRWTDEDGCCTTCGADAMEHLHQRWHAALKFTTGATDDVYAVVDGREVHVGRVVSQVEVRVDGNAYQRKAVADLLESADEQGYWGRPHEVRLDLQVRVPSLEAIGAVVQRSLIEAEVRRGH